MTSTVPNCRAVLNQYCQKHSASRRDEFIEDHSSGKPLFKCIITCMLDGSKIVEGSEWCFLRKEDAKEDAAQRILLKIKEMEDSRSRGIAGEPSEMIWKSQLQEHYDKQGDAGFELKHTVTELEGGSFVSSVFIPALQDEVKGEPWKNQNEAEQNTAKMVLLIRPNFESYYV